MAWRAALWVRVSTGHQDGDNQVPDLECFAGHHGHRIVRRFEVADSAWNGGKDGGSYRATLRAALDAAHRSEFSVIIVWPEVADDRGNQLSWPALRRRSQRWSQCGWQRYVGATTAGVGCLGE